MSYVEDDTIVEAGVGMLVAEAGSSAPEAMPAGVSEIAMGKAGVDSRRIRSYEGAEGQSAYQHAIKRLERFALGGAQKNGTVVSGVKLDANAQAQMRANIEAVLKRQGYQGEALTQQSNMLLYKLVQANLLYHPKETVTIEGQKSKINEVLSSDGMDHRQALKQLAGSDLTSSSEQDLAKWEQMLSRVEDSISDKGHAILEVKHKSGEKSFNTQKTAGYRSVVSGGVLTLEKQDELDRALFEAVKACNASEINNLVMQGANLNAINEDGDTPYDVIDDIISDEEVNDTDLTKEQVQAYIALRDGMQRAKALTEDDQDDLNEQLADLIKEGKVNEAGQLVQAHRGLTFNAYEDRDDRTTYLHYALDNDQAEMASYIIEQGVDVNVQDEDGQTALHYVMQMDEDDVSLETRMQLIDQILAKGGLINIVDEDGKTIMDYVDDLDQEEQEPMRQFLASRNGMTGADTLFAAIANGNLDATATLLKAGVDKDIRDKEGFGAMHYAGMCTKNTGEMVRLLAGFGVDLEMETSADVTPLHVAVQTGNLEFVNALLEADSDVDINAEDDKDNTPLHVALMAQNPEMVHLLLSKGAEVDIKNDDGKTALDLANETENAMLSQMVTHVANGGKMADFTPVVASPNAVGSLRESAQTPSAGTAPQVLSERDSF